MIIYWVIAVLIDLCLPLQPYLKEILKEICNYNAKNPHKSTWELKPEYRHYKGGEEAEWRSLPPTHTMYIYLGNRSENKLFYFWNLFLCSSF